MSHNSSDPQDVYIVKENSFSETAQKIARDIAWSVKALSDNLDNTVITIAESFEQIGNRVVELEIISTLSQRIPNLNIAFQKPQGYPGLLNKDAFLKKITEGQEFNEALHDTIGSFHLKYETCLVPSYAWSQGLSYSSIDVEKSNAFTTSPMPLSMQDKLVHDDYFSEIGKRHPDFLNDAPTFKCHSDDGVLFRNLFMTENIMNISGPVLLIAGARQVIDSESFLQPGMLEMLAASKKSIFSVALHTDRQRQGEKWHYAFLKAKGRLHRAGMSEQLLAHCDVFLQNQTGMTSNAPVSNLQAKAFFQTLRTGAKTALGHVQ